jgi:hypothetical protein
LTEKEWASTVAALGCILCRHQGVHKVPANLHHIREGQGLSQRAAGWLVVPLCWECHQGRNGFHGLGTRGFYQRYKLDEIDLLAMTIAQLAKTF